MSQIIVENLAKSFQIAKRQPGLINAFKGLVKREYKTVHALEGVSFKLDAGELVGYIGPNGAGKSTTVKILSGILVPDSGRCEIMGRTPWKQRVAHVRDIGVVFGQRTQLWWDLPVIESFDLLKDIYKIPHNRYKKTKNKLVEWLRLSELLDTPVRQLSLGQRMRCDLAASLLHSPPLLFLDEPTIGLDAISKLAVREFIKQLNKEKGVTVILTTHDMDDIEALCSRVMVIGQGSILTDGTIAQLRNRFTNEKRLIVDIDASGKHRSNIVSPLHGAKLVTTEGNRLVFRFNPDELSSAELVRMVSEQYDIKDLIIENPSIEEIIARLYEDLKL